MARVSRNTVFLFLARVVTPRSDGCINFQTKDESGREFAALKYQKVCLVFLFPSQI